jgi:hypothetical protein
MSKEELNVKFLFKQEKVQNEGGFYFAFEKVPGIPRRICFFFFFFFSMCRNSTEAS